MHMSVVHVKARREPLELKLWVFMTCVFRIEVGSFAQIGQTLKAPSLFSSSSILSFETEFFNEFEVSIGLYWPASESVQSLPP